MSNISFTAITDGSAIDASDVNGPLNTIYDDYNGSIDSNNLADNAVTTAKITDGNITAAKLGVGAVTGADGWVSTADTWVYVSASSFKIVGADRTTTYTKGTRLKFTQNTTVKYAVVVSSAFSTDTTVTIAVNTDYTIANDAITDNYYSYAACPQGYPPYFNFTVTPTCPGGTAPSYSNKQGTFSVNGGTVVAQYYLANTTGGTAGASANPINLNTPIRPSTATRSGFGAAYNGGTAINGFVIYDFLAITVPDNDVFYMSLLGSNITGADQNNAKRYLQLTLTYTMV